MNECKKCGVEIDNHRYHLGYTECVDCSETEKYSAHQVYPHKTGGYIQPVKSETKKHLQNIDRRSSGGGRTAKGIMADKSWDRWLERYHNPLPKKPKPEPKPVVNNYIPFDEANIKVVERFEKLGYDSACELTQSLYTEDKISLISKSKIMNGLADLQMMTSKERKIIKKSLKKSLTRIAFSM